MKHLLEYADNSTAKLKPAWMTAVEPRLLFRALMAALLLGSVLTITNQRGWIAGAQPLQLLQLILVFMLPFLVVSSAQIAGAYRAMADSLESTNNLVTENFFTTIISHGIPSRTIIIALVIGSANALAVITHALWYRIELATVPFVPLAQAFVLPLLFGLLSQTIAYRRARFQATHKSK